MAMRRSIRRRSTGRARRSPVLAVLSVVLAAAACSPTGPVATGPEASPFSADVGCDPAMAAALEAWADRGVAASLVDLGGSRECVGAYGLADPATGRRNTVDTVFSIGSITKAVTAAGIFKLVDDGVLTLDDTAGSHVGGLTGAAADATVHDLLLHTSGITGEHGVDHRPLSRAAAIDSISGLAISFDPGTGYQYANANYTLLALVIDSVTERGFRRFMIEEILLDRAGQPLGAGFWDGQPAPQGDRAWGHDAGSLAPLQRGDAPEPHWALDGNGGMAMTPLSMAEWTHALFTGRILSAPAIEALLSTSTRLAGDKELPGWTELDRTVFGEPAILTSGGGGSIGHLMNVAWFPESTRVIVIAENAGDYDVPSFSDDIAAALIAGTGLPLPPSIPAADPAILSSAAGRYLLGERGELVVDERDGGLLVASIGADAVRALYPVPETMTGLVERHESLTLDFISGHTPEGRRERDRLEAEHGPLVSTEIITTTFDGELVTLAILTFEDVEKVLSGSLNLNGGTEAYGYDTWPTTWFVAAGDGVFEPYLPHRENPPVHLRPTPDGFEIEGPDGTQLATPAGPT